jgi:polysaccharide deacetylase family protein (PEP-CTERM system associated)
MSGSMRNVLTVDVEEWFHICGVGSPLTPGEWHTLPSRVVETTDRLLDMLDRTGTRATFFVLGYVAEHHPKLVARIMHAGHEVGSHGHMHTRVYELTPESFENDLDRSLAALTACGVPTVTKFRAPEWSINDRSLWALDVLARRGFLVDSSMAPMRIVGNPSYPQGPHRRRTAHGELLEFPPAISRRFGHQMPFGGGWGLRMSRPATVLRAIEKRERAGLTNVFWVHPWEIDPQPPRVQLPAATRFAHYFRLDGFANRLEAILKGARFGPLPACQDVSSEANHDAVALEVRD